MTATHKTEWKTARLGDYFRIRHGYAFKGRFFSKTGELLVLTPGNFRPDGGLKFDGQQRYYKGEFPSEFLLKAGDLVIVMTDLTQNAPILGSPAFIPESGKLLHNQRLGKVVQLAEDDMDCRFLYYLLNSAGVRAQIKGSATGATVKHTAPERIYNVKVEIAGLNTQRKIATILAAYDDLIEDNTRRIRILDEMAQMIYREWFVDFRFPGHENVKMVDSELGLIPEGWEVSTLGELVDIIKGRKVANIYDTPSFDRSPYLLIDGLRHGDHVYTDKNAGPNAREDEVLMVMDGASSGEVFIGSSGVIGSTLAGFRPKGLTLLSPYVLFLLFREKRNEVAAKNIGSAIPHANKAYIIGIELTIPPADVSRYLHGELQLIFQLMMTLRLKNANLLRTRDLLLPRLISGEIDVENLDIDTGGASA